VILQRDFYFGRNTSDEVAWQWLRGMEPSFPVTLLHAPIPPTRSEVLRTYVALGFRHILPLGPTTSCSSSGCSS